MNYKNFIVEICENTIKNLKRELRIKRSLTYFMIILIAIQISAVYIKATFFNWACLGGLISNLWWLFCETLLSKEDLRFEKERLLNFESAIDNEISKKLNDEYKASKKIYDFSKEKYELLCQELSYEIDKLKQSQCNPINP